MVRFLTVSTYFLIFTFYVVSVSIMTYFTLVIELFIKVSMVILCMSYPDF